MMREFNQSYSSHTRWNLNQIRRNNRKRIRGISEMIPYQPQSDNWCQRRRISARLTCFMFLLYTGSISDAFQITPSNPLTHYKLNFRKASFPSIKSLNAIRRKKFVKKDVLVEPSSYRHDDDDEDDDDEEFNVPMQRQRMSFANDDDDEEEKQLKKATTKTTATVSKSHFFSQKSIDDPSFRIVESISQTPSTSIANAKDSIFQQLCHNANIVRPSKIQSMAWPMLLRQQQNYQHQNQQESSSAVVIADQTGSGKTLAYLIPLIQHMIHDTRNNPKSDTLLSNSNTAAAPKLLILTPTAELADQIRAVCSRLSGESSNERTTKPLFKTVVLTATGQHATNIRDQIRLLQQYKNNVDVIISTPGRIATILRTKQSAQRILDIQYLQAVVLDEVDVLLLDETFGPQLQTIGEATTPPDAEEQQQQQPSTLFVFVTATLPDSVLGQIQEQFTNTILIKGPGLHRVAPTVIEKLIDVSVPPSMNRNIDLCFDIKAKALQQALRQNRCQRTLIFCNTVGTCRQVENLLYRIDRQQQIYTVKAYHNAMTADARNENLSFFAKAGKGATNDRVAIMGSRGSTSSSSSSSAPSSSTSFVLVCTDRAARGVDFHQAAVDHVILFDFPNDPAEYVRRVGRTARAGRTGASTVFAYGWQLPIARSIMGQQSIQDDDYNGGSNRKKRDDGNTIDENDEYMGGVQGRRKSMKRINGKKASRLSDEVIGSNIANGKLWNEKLSSMDEQA